MNKFLKLAMVIDNEVDEIFNNRWALLGLFLMSAAFTILYTRMDLVYPAQLAGVLYGMLFFAVFNFRRTQDTVSKEEHLVVVTLLDRVMMQIQLRQWFYHTKQLYAMWNIIRNDSVPLGLKTKMLVNDNDIHMQLIEMMSELEDEGVMVVMDKDGKLKILDEPSLEETAGGD